jgi:dipeptidase E
MRDRVRSMRMLLTSAGPANGSMRSALAELLGRPFEEAAVVLVLTASLVVPGDKRWVIKDLALLDELGFRQIDILDLAVPSPEAVAARLREADVIYVEGGDQYHLARTLLRRHLVELFEELLADRVYVGASAGSMIFSRHLGARTAMLFGDEEDTTGVAPPFGLFDWYVQPHWHSAFKPERDDPWAERIAGAAGFPVYVLDDDSAVRVRGDGAPGVDPVVDVVSEGRWRLVGS